jgi:GNAT superfamily N-acetyltransferase
MTVNKKQILRLSGNVFFIQVGAVLAAFALIGGDGIGGLYFVATEAGMRGKGYGAATVSAALDELERRSVSYCILHATKLGKPVYERLGFVDECGLTIYSFPG